jgi:TRAP-type C4-dicarboxylate transport system permease small subunit
MWDKVVRFNSFVFLIGSILILFLGMLTLIDVFGRYLLNKPLKGSLEISELIMASVLFLCLAYSFFLKSHIKVDVIVSKFSPRMQGYWEAWANMISLLFLCLVVWQGAKRAIEQLGNYTEILKIPISPIAFLVPIGCLFSCLYLVGHILSGLHNTKNHRKEDP